MTAKWYYAEEGQIIGPVEFADVEARINPAENKRHIVWSEGMADWADAKDVPAFAHVFQAKPPPIPPRFAPTALSANDQIVASSGIPPLRAEPPTSMPTIAPSNWHPWRRYFARMFDLVAFTLCFSVGIGLTFPDLFNDTGKSSSAHDQLLGVLILVAYIPFEGFCLYAFGTTLGKALYGIRLIPKENTILFSTAIWRSLLVWIRGLGLGIPIISLITLITAFNNLKKTGRTSWDSDIGWIANHSILSLGRWVAIFGCWVTLLFVFGVLIAIGST